MIVQQIISQVACLNGYVLRKANGGWMYYDSSPSNSSQDNAFAEAKGPGRWALSSLSNKIKANQRTATWANALIGIIGAFISSNILLPIEAYCEQQKTVKHVTESSKSIAATSKRSEETENEEYEQEEDMEEFDAEQLAQERAENAHYTTLANELRKSMELPQQSLFRSVALLIIEDSHGVKRHIVGTTCEASCFIQNSICAERSAVAQLAATHNEFSRVVKIIRVTDSPNWDFPGSSSREFLASTCERDTPVVICGSRDANDFLVTSVGELYPYPNVYANLDRMECVLFGSHLAELVETPRDDEVSRVYEMARLAAKRDCDVDLHPLSLGAAVLFEDGTIEVAWQQKNPEYASCLDPVSLLAMVLETKNLEGISPKLILQADQFGVLHAPVASARAFLASRDYNQTHLFVHDSSGKLHKVTPGQLLPQASDLLGFDPQDYSQSEDA